MEPEKPDLAAGGRFLLLAGCVAIGAFLRYRACLTEFWLDEIWSLLIIKTSAVKGAWDIVANLRHDNNHIINSLWLYWIGDTKNWFWYRLPALLAGIGSIVAACSSARTEGRGAGLFAAFLTAFSFPLILYSSEARGYGPAVFFSLLAFYALRDFFATGRTSRIFILNASAALAAFSHPSFVYVFLGMASWSAARIFGGAETGRHAPPRGLAGRVAEMAALNAFPTLVFVFLYFAHLKGMKVGGGPHFTIMQAASDAAALALGAPRSGLFGTSALLAVFGLTCGGVLKLYREKDDLWVFYLSTLILAPALVLAASRPKVIYFRYFVILIPFFYLFCARLIHDLWRISAKGKILAAVLLALFLLGQSAHLLRFSEKGRGGCGRALAFMEEKTAGDTILVGSSDDYLNIKILTFYSQFLKPGKNIFYVSNADLPTDPPDWFIVVRHEPGLNLENGIRIGKNHDYRLVRVFRYSGFSGLDWFLYQRFR